MSQLPEPDYPDRVNGHKLWQRVHRYGTEIIKPYYQCTACGATEISYQSFRAYGCPGSDYTGAPLVDTTDVQTGGEQT